ncbi:MAG: SDR family NAD(P)-dependent oxidoreductase [Gammaproteobacteria bacterium]
MASGDPAKARSVLITGASSGIGLCSAYGLRARGYRVIATARKTEDVAQLSAAGFPALALDVADSRSVHAAATEALRMSGGALYGLFNNAGFGQVGALTDLTRAALREQFEVNVFGAHELTRAVLPAMCARGEGRIIQTSSLLGLVCVKYRGAYNASKYALEALSDTLRLELAGSGVHVTLIEPGPIDSRFRSSAQAVYEQRQRSGDLPQGPAQRAVEASLRREGGRKWFTLPPEAVVKKVIKALESPNPKPRYRVTAPSHVLALLKRWLPDRAMDALLGSI